MGKYVTPTLYNPDQGNSQECSPGLAVMIAVAAVIWNAAIVIEYFGVVIAAAGAVAYKGAGTKC